jgi:hypothetical protein
MSVLGPFIGRFHQNILLLQALLPLLLPCRAGVRKLVRLRHYSVNTIHYLYTNKKSGFLANKPDLVLVVSLKHFLKPNLHLVYIMVAL